MQTKLDITQDIQPLTTFRNNSVKMLKQLKKTGRPVVLTVNGKTEAVIQSAAAYQHLMDIAAGRTRPAEEVFAEMRKQHGLSR